MFSLGYVVTCSIVVGYFGIFGFWYDVSCVPPLVGVERLKKREATKKVSGGGYASEVEDVAAYLRVKELPKSKRENKPG